MNVLLGLLLVFGVGGCKGGPIRPAPPERAALYTGKWSGTINGWEVELHIQGSAGDLIGLTGTGTARNPATEESHRLSLFGFGSLNDAHGTANFMMGINAQEIVPGVLTGGQTSGEFRGNVAGDGRRWPGVWTATLNDAAPIFGLGNYPVTLTKE